jgi:hypothetical protein
MYPLIVGSSQAVRKQLIISDPPSTVNAIGVSARQQFTLGSRPIETD